MMIRQILFYYICHIIVDKKQTNMFTLSFIIKIKKMIRNLNYFYGKFLKFFVKCQLVFDFNSSEENEFF